MKEVSIRNIYLLKFTRSHINFRDIEHEKIPKLVKLMFRNEQ